MYHTSKNHRDRVSKKVRVTGGVFIAIFFFFLNVRLLWVAVRVYSAFERKK